MGRTLFNASFEQSQNICPNLFSEEKPTSYGFGLYESFKFLHKIGIFFVVLAFTILIYGVSVEFPAGVAKVVLNKETSQYISEDIVRGMGGFVVLKPIIVFILALMLLLAIFNLLPKKNYMVQRMFGMINLLLFNFVALFGLMPSALGVSLGATGRLGFTILCIWGVGLWITAWQCRSNKIKQELYGDMEKIQDSYIKRIWDKSRKLWLVSFVLLPFGFVILNIFWLRIGLSTEPTFLNCVWMFTAPLYFGVFTILISIILKIFINGFYFAKYAEQYRVLWAVSDEQWYGKRKAKKLRKK